MSSFYLWLTKIALHYRQLAIDQQLALTGLWSLILTWLTIGYKIKKMADESEFYLSTDFRVTDVPPSYY